MKTRKKLVCSVLTLVMALSLAACGGSSVKEAELIVFAAASMQETLTETGENCMKEHKDIKLTFNFDSSGTLKTQIQEGTECPARRLGSGSAA